MKCTKVATSLGNCNKRRTDLRVEFDATLEAMQMVTDSASGRELEHRLNSFRQEEVIFQEQEEGDTDAEMVEEGECGDGEPSGPQGAAGTEDAPPLDPAGDAVSPEEDAFLMQQASQPIDPAAGSHSPRSEAGTVSGEMAELSLTSPGQPGPGEDETQQ